MPGTTLARVIACASVVCLAFTAAAQYHERILSFEAVVEIQADGTANIIETITVYANSDQIQRGIFRDLPARGVKPARVLRDGEPEDFHIERSAIGTRVYIGSADRYLDPGEHTYTIEYPWRRVVRHFDEHDEVYWNVTGTQWAFPIERARARITLPEPVEPGLLRAEGYTGRDGARGTAYVPTVPEAGVAEFVTSAPLGPQEGLTVVLSFPKGVVEPPTGGELALEYARYVLYEWGGLAGFGLVVLYYFTVWVIAGRDPSAGRVLPVDHPPADHSPAACRYVRDMGYDGTTFSAAIVDLAYKGHLRIEQDETQFVLVQESGSSEPVYPDEQAIMDTLFADGAEVLVSRTENNDKFMQARAAAARSLQADYAGIYFKQNLWYLIPGLALSLMALYQVFPSRDRINDMELAIFMTLFLSIWSVAVTFLAWLAFSTWQYARREPDKGESFGVVLVTAMAVLFWIVEFILLGVVAVVTSFVFACGVLFVAALNVAFGYLLRRHTSVGRALLDRIESFEQWLTDATVHRFSAAGSEEASVRYERYLPYAMAIDREEDWSREFDQALSTAAAAPDAAPSYRPNWYRRRNPSFSGPSYSMGSFMTAFSHSFSEAIDTASTAPSSSSSSSGSSGSGGGGSSGGGSGGGGGGGW